MEKTEEKILLDIGCGNNPVNKDGYRTIGIDLKRNTKADIVCDLECYLPFKSDTFDEIYCYNVLEHITNIIKLLEELYRVGKSKTIIKINVPHFSGMDTHQDITHKRGFGSRSFYPFIGKDPNCSHYGKCKFKQLKRKIFFWEITELRNIRIQEWFGLGILANKLTSIYERFLCYIFPAQGIYFELEIDK
jgi:SAM-dependent methyltransferase